MFYSYLSSWSSKIEKIILNYPNILPFLINLFFVTLAYSIFIVQFQTLDDVGMMLANSGIVLTKQPTEDIFYLHIFLSTFLKELYLVFPTINWYAILFCSVLFLSYWQLGRILFKNYPKFITLILYISFFLICALKNFIYLQFTIVAVILAITGFVTIISELKSQKISSYVITFACILLSSFIRFHSLLLVCLLVSPFLLFTLMQVKSNKTRLIQVFFLFISLGITYLCTYYHESQYNYYIKFLKGFGQFNDYNKFKDATSDVQEKVLKTVNWSQNDIKLMHSWFCMDSKTYSIEKQQTALSIIADSGHLNVKQKASESIYYFVYILKNRYAEFSIILFMILMMFCDKSKYKIILVTLFVIVSLIILMVFFLKPPPERVFFPMLEYLCLLPLLFITPTNETSVGKFIWQYFNPHYLLLVIILLFAHKVNLLYKNSIRLRAGNEQLRKLVSKIPTEGRTYVSWGGAFISNNILPFENKDYLRGINVVVSMPQPFNFNVDAYPMDLITNPNTYLIVNTAYGMDINLYIQYMKEHYNKEIIVKDEVIDETSEIKILKCSAR
jgi:hypothetical protein